MPAWRPCWPFPVPLPFWVLARACWTLAAAAAIFLPPSWPHSPAFPATWAWTLTRGSLPGQGALQSGRPCGAPAPAPAVSLAWQRRCALLAWTQPGCPPPLPSARLPPGPCAPLPLALTQSVNSGQRTSSPQHALRSSPQWLCQSPGQQAALPLPHPGSSSSLPHWARQVLQRAGVLLTWILSLYPMDHWHPPPHHPFHHHHHHRVSACCCPTQLALAPGPQQSCSSAGWRVGLQHWQQTSPQKGQKGGLRPRLPPPRHPRPHPT